MPPSLTTGKNTPALIPDLVNMASDPSVSASDLLRRALVVAHRLAVPELAEWISHELEGYGDKPVPSYRILRGKPEVWNPYRGYVPMGFADAKYAEAVSVAPAAQSIPELEQLSKSTTGIRMRYSPSLENRLMKDMDAALTPSLGLSTAQVHAIVETVRSRILKWALDLEGQGVLGEGMRFTSQEKQIVQEQHYHFGDVTGSQIQIGSTGASQTQTNISNGVDLDAVKGLIDELSAALDRGVVGGEVADELRAEVATLKAQAASPKPKWETIRSAARTIKTVAEGAAANLLAELGKPYTQTLFALAATAAGA